MSKTNALKAWDKIKPSENLLADILKALEIQKQSEQWIKDDGKYIPHPATWLNGKRWEDEEFSVPEEISPDDILTLDMIATLPDDTSRTLDELKSLSLEELL